jgi:hypothetical protein
MKNLLLITAMLISTSIYAQELRTNKVDDFTGESKMITKDYKIGKSTLGYLCAYFVRVNDAHSICLYVNFKDFGCGGARDNYITFLFKDKTTLTLPHDILDINCGDYAESMYILDSFKIDMLKTKEISKIRFRQSEGYVDFTASGIYTVKQLLDILK